MSQYDTNLNSRMCTGMLYLMCECDGCNLFYTRKSLSLKTKRKDRHVENLSVPLNMNEALSLNYNVIILHLTVSYS
jgi:hypothetical protein